MCSRCKSKIAQWQQIRVESVRQRMSLLRLCLGHGETELANETDRGFEEEMFSSLEMLWLDGIVSSVLELIK